MKELKKQEKEWVLYDVGNSAFVLLCTTIIPIYFKNIAAAQGVSSAQSTAYLSYALSVCTILVALSGPVLGTLSDTQGHKKPISVREIRMARHPRNGFSSGSKA